MGLAAGAWPSYTLLFMKSRSRAALIALRTPTSAVGPRWALGTKEVVASGMLTRSNFLFLAR